MKFTATQIAEALGGTIDGNPDVEVSNLSKIEEGTPGTLSFLANPKYTPFLYKTQASIVIVNQDFVAEHPTTATLIRVKNAYASFADLLAMYQESKGKRSGISPQAYISPSATIGKDVYIGEFASVGDHTVVGDNCQIFPQATVGYNCRIGNETIINSGVRVYDDCIIGNFCTLHAGVVIGADGFGFAPQESEDYRKVPQIGNVIIEDQVEIGANTTIDRATMGSTIIRKGAKIDNLIQIAHNVEIGENTVIAAQTGISGSTRIGKNCMIGGQVGIVGHLKIADKVMIAAQSGISKSITEVGAVVEGSPAFNIREYQRSFVHFKRLDHLVKRVNQLERK